VGGICWREGCNILWVMWGGGRTVGFCYICVEDNGHLTPFCCPSSKDVKPCCKTTHSLCSLRCFGLRQRAIWLPTFRERPVTHSGSVQGCWLQPAGFHVVVSQGTTLLYPLLTR